MNLRDFISTNTQTSGILTSEALDASFKHILEQTPPPRHICEIDGHIGVLASRLCAYCGEVIRELTPDENHLLLGEFWA